MTPEALSRLHGQCFPARPWSAREFADLTEARGVIWHANAAQTGFVVAQTVPPEAEVLTIAVAPAAQQKGVGRALMATLIRDLSSLNISELFLEVAEDNTAARALYAALGFDEAGRRSGYYPRDTGAVDALILRLTIG